MSSTFVEDSDFSASHASNKINMSSSVYRA